MDKRTKKIGRIAHKVLLFVREGKQDLANRNGQRLSRIIEKKQSYSSFQSETGGDKGFITL